MNRDCKGIKRAAGGVFISLLLGCATSANLLCEISVPPGTWHVEHYGGDECTVEAVQECSEPETKGARGSLAYFDKYEYVEIAEWSSGDTCPVCRRKGKKSEVFCGNIDLMSDAFCGQGRYENDTYYPPICPAEVVQGCYCANEHRWSVKGS